MLRPWMYNSVLPTCIRSTVSYQLSGSRHESQRAGASETGPCTRKSVDPSESVSMCAYAPNSCVCKGEALVCGCLRNGVSDMRLRAACLSSFSPCSPHAIIPLSSPYVSLVSVTRFISRATYARVRQSPLIVSL